MSDLDHSIGPVWGTDARHADDLLRTARAERWHVELVEAAVAAGTRRIRQYRDWWADQKITAERQLRETSARALDCADHGRIIAELEQQAYRSDRDYRAADQSRRAYLAGLYNLDRAAQALQARLAAGDPVPSLGDLADLASKAIAEIHHNARWR